jgi:hypothetical protein
MIKSIFVLAAAVIAAPAMAQAPAPAALPTCSAKVTDSCQQSPAQQARAMTGAQADARDARNGGAWTPDKRTTGMSSTDHATKKAKKATKAATAPM